MPLLHCKKCHHEWETGKKTEKCPWCKNEGYVLEEKTDLELMVESDWFKQGRFLSGL